MNIQSIQSMIIGVILVFAQTPARAVVEMTSSQISGKETLVNLYVNFESEPSFDEVTFYFDYNFASKISNVNLIGNWDVLAIQPDLQLPANGYLDIVWTDPVAPTPTKFNLSVVVSSLSLKPNNINYELYRSNNFERVSSGSVVGKIFSPVPEPDSLALLGAGLVAALILSQLHLKKNEAA